MKSTEPTNIFKLGVKKTGQFAPTIPACGLGGYFDNKEYVLFCSTNTKASDMFAVAQSKKGLYTKVIQIWLL